MERSQRTDLDEFYPTVDPKSPDLQQRLEEWQDHYNQYLSFAKNASADRSLRGNAFITVMETAELRDLDDPADTRDPPRNRTLLVEAQWVLDPW